MLLTECLFKLVYCTFCWYWHCVVNNSGVIFFRNETVTVHIRSTKFRVYLTSCAKQSNVSCVICTLFCHEIALVVQCVVCVCRNLRQNNSYVF